MNTKMQAKQEEIYPQISQISADFCESGTKKKEFLTERTESTEMQAKQEENLIADSKD